MPVRGREGEAWALLDPHSVLGVQILWSPSGQNQEQTAKAETLLPEVWLGFSFQEDQGKMSSGDGLRFCSVALIWVRL